ncbi:MAG: peptidylprolyl isomerase [Thermoleophilia bacterium]|nr:peptidylprolyl isomerase [Thermoleophilia bacterium]MDH4339624.1 peptidylprolyl isomerase [Thermoleophilia bacterium]MDH5281213.1 peptidylprolyl isomerase [Thermoleophilia bacterium]
MNLVRITLAVLGATAALVASACGGSADVPSGSVALVAGTEISKGELDQLLDQAKQGYKANKQEFPKAGTPEYQSIQTQYVAYLVQRQEFRQAAEELGIEVTEKDVAAAEDELVKSRFDGDRKEYEKALKQQGLTPNDYRLTLETSVLAQKLFDEVTKDTKVTDQDILAYYTQNQSQYGTPESRDVRHILIAEKAADGKVDFAKSKAKADRIYAELEGGADFASLAKVNSADPGSKDSGGKLTISRGQTVPEFDKVSFELDKGELSKPVKTTYGYHVIEAVSPVRPAKTTPLDEVKESIRTTLLQQKRNEVMSAWVEDLRSEYDGKVSYAVGYEPPELPEAPTETQ